MEQMKRKCLTEETVNGFLKTEFHQMFNDSNQRKYFHTAPGGEIEE